MSDPDVEAVAKAVRFLTEVPPSIPAPAPDKRLTQLLELFSPKWRLLAEIVAPERAQRFVMPARRLKARGLVESDLRLKGYVFWRITPLGLRVRHLLRQNQGGEVSHD